MRSDVAGRESTETNGLPGRKGSVFNVSTTNIYLLGFPAVVLLVCLMFSLVMWSAGKATPAEVNPDSTDRGVVGESGGSENLGFTPGSGDMELPLPRSTVRKATVSSSKAAPFKRSAIVRRSIRTRRKISNPVKVANVGLLTAQSVEPCTTDDCRLQSDYLKQTMNFAKDPCHDLYDFVCGNYWVHPDGPYAQAEGAMRNATILALQAEAVPARHQSAWQKAAGLFQACHGFVTTYRNELEELKWYMVRLNLDLLNLLASKTVDPANMIVRLALDLGTPALFDLKVLEDDFIDQKRVIQFQISDFQAAWHTKRTGLAQSSTKKIAEYIHDRLLLYRGFDPDRDKDLVDMISSFDETLTSTLTKHVKPNTAFTILAIENLGELMYRLVSAGDWTNFFSRYTNKVYSGGDMIQFQTELIGALMELVHVPHFGKEGFRAMLAWGLFDSLVDYAMPLQLVGRKEKQKACYDLVIQVMELAVTSQYFRSKVHSVTLRKAKDMFSTIQRAFEGTLRDSSWLKMMGLDFALRRLHKMEGLVGSPDERLDETFVNRHYGHFPDMAPAGRFLDAWLPVLSARAHQKWMDQKHVAFNMSMASPAYVKGSNVVAIPAGALLPVFFYADGNAALNYGSLGDALGQQVMNAFVMNEDASYCLSKEEQWLSLGKKECARRSHEEAGYPVTNQVSNQPARLADVSDMVGIATAHGALLSLPSVQRTQTLPNVNLTAAQLLFVGHCMTTCKYDDRTPSGRFAGPRARCNVPAMNMDAFSAAFGCAAGARMNPEAKCSFWK